MMSNELQTALQWALNNDKGLLAMGAGMNDLTAVYPYHAGGKELFVKARFDKDGKKWVKPFHHDGKRYKMGEPKGLTQKPLYMPKPFDDVVYIVEGEKCVHSLLDIGLSATTTGGANSVKSCDFSPLQGKRCVLWRDNDNSGMTWQNDLINALQGFNIDVIDIANITLPTGETLPPKADCYDLIQALYANGDDDSNIVQMINQLPRLSDIQAQISDMQEPLEALDPLAELEYKKSQLLECISELAKLDDIKIMLACGEVARRFGIPKDKVMQLVNEHKQGDFIPEVTPYHESVSHDEVFNDLYRLIDEHMAIDEPLKVAFVLWVIFTYLTDISDFAPIAWITAPEKQCGKSTLLGLFERVVNKPMTFTDITKAVLFRIMESNKPTLLIDEIDVSLKDNKDISQVINSGYSRHAPYVPRINNDKGGAVERFNVFGAKVFSGIGETKDTFSSRAIRFELRRKTNNDKVKRTNNKTLPYTKTEVIRQKIKRWSMDYKEQVKAVDTPLLNINDREFDKWEILLQIATVLGVYDRAVTACLTICKHDGEQSHNIALLQDVRDVFLIDKLSQKDLLEKLTADESLQWATHNNGMALTQYQLGKMLKSFNITTQSIRFGQDVIKGYKRQQFDEVFNIYLPKKQDDEVTFLIDP